MNRSGVLVVGAIAFALAAAGILMQTNFLDLRESFFPSRLPSPEANLVVRMNDVASAGGYAITFANRDAEQWQVAAGHRLEKFSIDGGAIVFARLTSMTPLVADSFEWPTQGLSVSLPPDFGNRSNGRSIEIGVVARAASGHPNATLSAVYATRQAGNSGWKKVPVGSQFELKTIKYDVPKLEGGYTNPPVFVLNADASGSGGSIELIGIYFKIL